MAGGEPSAYDQGAEQGRINATLKQHGEHLAKINGSQAESVVVQGMMREELHLMRMEIAELRQQSKADADTRIALAAELGKAEQARREKDKDTADALKLKGDNEWMPFIRIAGVLGLIATALTIYFLVKPR